MSASLAYVATVALFSLHSFAIASPLVARAGQVVWSPPITAPEAGDVWTVGSTQLVSWDTNEVPPSAANNTGTLLLGYWDDSGENLDVDNPLASDFLLVDGCVHVDVPDVEPRDTYIVVLMGNSGNASPEFTIVKGGSTSATPYGSSDKLTPQDDSNDPDLIDPEALSEDASTPAPCRERPPNSTSGSGSGLTGKRALDEGLNKHC